MEKEETARKIRENEELIELYIRVDVYKDSGSELIERRRRTKEGAKEQIYYGKRLKEMILSSSLPDEVKGRLVHEVEKKMEMYEEILRGS
jgi:hypothetical protein